MEAEKQGLSWAFALGMWQNCQRAAQADGRAPAADVHKGATRVFLTLHT